MELIRNKANETLRIAGSNVQFDPFTLMTIISILVAVVRLVIACQTLWKVRHPGLFARTRLKSIIRHYCGDKYSLFEQREIYLAVLAIGQDTTDAEVRAMFEEAAAGNIPFEEVPE